MCNDSKELKGLIRARKRVYLTERNNIKRFEAFAEKCEHRKLVIEEEKNYVDWHSCTNSNPIFQGGFMIHCNFSHCPLLKWNEQFYV